jgi:hypothetical protein
VNYESKTSRQTGVARLLCVLLVHILKTGVERFLCGLLQHILKHILVKLIFKTFTLENSKKKGPNIFPRPGIRSLCRGSAHLANTLFSVRNKLPASFASVWYGHNHLADYNIMT